MASVLDLYEAVKRRECILFLGAGVHYPPPDDLLDYEYPEAERPPLGTSFSQSIAKESLHKVLAGSKADPIEKTATAQRKVRAEDLRAKRRYLWQNKDNLQRTSWFYHLQYQRAALVNRVSESVEQGKKPSAIVRALAEIDFPIVVTTNYDRLFEQALGILSKKVSPIIYDPERREQMVDLRGLPRKGERWLYKIHGCVSRPESIVITDEDYIKFVMRMNDGEDFHPVPAKIRSQLAEWPTLFVGYSLLDYNLRLLFRTLRWKIKPSVRPPTFSLDLRPDILIRATYGVLESELAREPLVTFIARDIWKFVPDLYGEVTGKKMPA
jgi:hypothetical protein